LSSLATKTSPFLNGSLGFLLSSVYNCNNSCPHCSLCLASRSYAATSSILLTNYIRYCIIDLNIRFLSPEALDFVESLLRQMASFNLLHKLRSLDLPTHNIMDFFNNHVSSLSSVSSLSCSAVADPLLRGLSSLTYLHCRGHISADIQNQLLPTMTSLIHLHIDYPEHLFSARFTSRRFWAASLTNPCQQPGPKDGIPLQALTKLESLGLMGIDVRSPPLLLAFARLVDLDLSYCTFEATHLSVFTNLTKLTIRSITSSEYVWSDAISAASKLTKLVDLAATQHYNTAYWKIPTV